MICGIFDKLCKIVLVCSYICLNMPCFYCKKTNHLSQQCYFKRTSSSKQPDGSALGDSGPIDARARLICRTATHERDSDISLAQRRSDGSLRGLAVSGIGLSSIFSSADRVPSCEAYCNMLDHQLLKRRERLV